MPDAVDLPAWRRILDEVRTERPDLASVFEHAAPTEISARAVTLVYDPSSFLADRAREGSAVELLTRLARAHLDASTEVTIGIDSRAGGLATVAWLEESERHARLERARRAVAEHPLVKAAIEVLGAELRDVRLQGEEG